jgi:hypothetical protein
MSSHLISRWLWFEMWVEENSNGWNMTGMIIDDENIV